MTASWASVSSGLICCWDFPRSIVNCLASFPEHVLKESYLLSFNLEILGCGAAFMFVTASSNVEPIGIGWEWNNVAFCGFSRAEGPEVPLFGILSPVEKTVLGDSWTPTGDGGMLRETVFFLRWSPNWNSASLCTPDDDTFPCFTINSRRWTHLYNLKNH